MEEKANGSRLVPSSENEVDPNDLTVKRAVHIEESEEFSQLCTVVNLVKVMPGSNLLLSAVTAEDGVIRLFRSWLREQAQKEGNDSEIMWVDQDQNVGLKLRVKEKRRAGQTASILVHRDEMAVSYDVYIEGMSFLFNPFLSAILILFSRTTYSHHSGFVDPRAIVAGAAEL